MDDNELDTKYKGAVELNLPSEQGGQCGAKWGQACKLYVHRVKEWVEAGTGAN
jgi:hypothetical protein